MSRRSGKEIWFTTKIGRFDMKYKRLQQLDSLMPELFRYIVLNAERKGLVRRGVAGAVIGAVDAPVWLHTDWIPAAFSESRNKTINRV